MKSHHTQVQQRPNTTTTPLPLGNFSRVCVCVCVCVLASVIASLWSSCSVSFFFSSLTRLLLLRLPSSSACSASSLLCCLCTKHTLNPRQQWIHLLLSGSPPLLKRTLEDKYVPSRRNQALQHCVCVCVFFSSSQCMDTACATLPSSSSSSHSSRHLPSCPLVFLLFCVASRNRSARTKPEEAKRIQRGVRGFLSSTSSVLRFVGEHSP
jgi:hypothetical protein